MNRILTLFLVTVVHGFSYGQNLYLCYEPIKQDIKKGEWENIDAHLENMYAEFSDSLIVPFTINRIGNELFEIQDFDKLYKYSKLMLAFDHEKLNTRFPESSNQKWDAYCRSLSKYRIQNWGHFYLASSYLERKQYDSCLIHLDQSNIGNYSSLPRRYTYNVSAGIHTTVMRSICLEGLGKFSEARKMLVPYLFLDKFYEVPYYYTHCDVIDQYFKLFDKSNNDSPHNFSSQNVFIIEAIYKNEKGSFPRTEYTASNDSIVKPSGWSFFEYSLAGKFILVEDSYVPILYRLQQLFIS